MNVKLINKNQRSTAAVCRICSLLMIFIFTSLSATIYAQNFEEDLKKVSEKYKSGNYLLEVNYIFYGGHESAKALDKQTVLIKKYEDYFHTNQFGTEIISNSKYVLVIDHQNKIMALELKHKESTAKDRAKAQKEVDELYQNLYTTLGIDPEKAKVTKEDIKTTYLGQKEGHKGYRLSYSFGEHEHLELYFNSEHLIAEVWMYFRTPMEVEEGVFKKPKVKMIYGKQNLNPIFDQKEFDIKKYVEIGKNKEVNITDKRYQSFELINHLKD
jgi:hypothetical protein